jgi:hypothetical protein
MAEALQMRRSGVNLFFLELLPAFRCNHYYFVGAFFGASSCFPLQSLLFLKEKIIKDFHYNQG